MSLSCFQGIQRQKYFTTRRLVILENSKAQTLLMSVIKPMEFPIPSRPQTLNTITKSMMFYKSTLLLLLSNPTSTALQVIIILCLLLSTNKLLPFLANILNAFITVLNHLDANISWLYYYCFTRLKHILKYLPSLGDLILFSQISSRNKLYLYFIFLLKLEV